MPSDPTVLNTHPDPKAEAGDRRQRALGVLMIVAAFGLLGYNSLASAWHRTWLREAYVPQLEADVRRSPADGPALALLGGRFAQAGDPRAGATLQKAIDAGENTPALWQTLAAVKCFLGDRQGAVQALQDGKRAQGGDNANMDAAIDKVQGMSSKADPRALAQAACPGFPNVLVDAYAQGSYLNGLVAWWGKKHPADSGFATRQEWASDEPQNQQAQQLWAAALIMNERPTDAVGVLENVVNANPNSADAHKALAESMEAAGMNGPAAIGYLETLKLEGGGGSLDALLGLGRCAQLAGLPYARAAFLRATTLTPSSTDAWIGLGRAEMATSPRESIAAFETAAKLQPTRTDYLLDYALALENAGRNEDALAAIDKFVAGNPQNFAGYYQRGHLFMTDHSSTNYLASAASDMKQAVKLAPHNAFAERDLGVILLQQGDTSGARDELVDAVKDDPYDAGAHRALGQAYGKLGQSKGAAKSSQIADEITGIDRQLASLQSPTVKQYEDAGYHKTLARLDYVMGQPMAAVHEVQIVQEIQHDPKSFDAQYQHIRGDVAAVLGADAVGR